jgi:hypothetical protein
VHVLDVCVTVAVLVFLQPAHVYGGLRYVDEGRVPTLCSALDWSTISRCTKAQCKVRSYDDGAAAVASIEEL